MKSVDLFFSYNPHDRAAALDLHARVRSRGISSFLDQENLWPALSWQDALEQALRSSRAMVVVLGPSGLGTRQRSEVLFALSFEVGDVKRQLPIILVLLRGSLPPTEFRSLYPYVDLRNPANEADAFETLVRSILGEESNEKNGDSVCPYLGLRAFQEEDQTFYFGHDALIEKIAVSIREQPILVVVGPSGSGKSSVVMAGLLPRLRQERLPTWEAIRFMPGENPWSQMAFALVPLLDPKTLTAVQMIEEAKTLEP